MPRLSDIKLDPSKFRGKGMRPWNDPSVIKPSQSTKEEIDELLIIHEQASDTQRKSVSNALAESEQCVSNTLANREQTRDAKIESVSNALAEPLATVLAKREQSVSKALANINKYKNTEAIETLVGNERNLLNFLFQKCKSIGSLESPIITTDELRNLLKINAVHLRNLIYRLTKKDIIQISKLKNGRAGWRKFQFSKEIFQQLSLDDSVSNALANRKHSVSNALAEPLAEPLAAVSSSSSLINNKETTTSEENKLTDEWLAINIQPLQDIGFTITHLTQIARQGILSAEIVQGSIDAFAFDLVYNKKGAAIKGNPLNYFMGIVRNGQPYAPPGNYESPQDREMRKYLERQREIEEMRKAREEKLINLAFSEWENEQSEEEKQTLLSPEIRASKLSAAKTASLRAYFVREIWPLKRKKLFEEAVIS